MELLYIVKTVHFLTIQTLQQAVLGPPLPTQPRHLHPGCAPRPAETAHSPQAARSTLYFPPAHKGAHPARCSESCRGEAKFHARRADPGTGLPSPPGCGQRAPCLGRAVEAPFCTVPPRGTEALPATRCAGSTGVLVVVSPQGGPGPQATATPTPSSTAVVQRFWL